MVLGKNVQCFFPAILGNEPTRRLREEENQNKNNSGKTSLHDGRDSPGPGGLEVQVATVGSPSSKNVTQPPEVVVHTSHRSTVGRVGKLDSVGRTGGRSEGCTQTEEETASHEHAHGLCGCLHGGSNPDDEASNEDTNFTAIAVGQETTEGESSYLSKVVDDEDQTG
jgi:hypothetical protein